MQDQRQPRYYATHALEDLTEFRALVNETPSYPAKELAYLDAITEILKESVKFILPQDGKMIEFGPELTQSQLDMLRLPYKTICLEYPCTPSKKPPSSARFLAEAPVSKSCVLAQETTVDGDEGVLLLPVFYVDLEKRWSMQPVHFFFPYQQVLGHLEQSQLPKDWQERLKEDDPVASKRLKLSAVRTKVIVGMPTYINHVARSHKISAEKIVMTMMYETQREFRVLVEFCNVLNCSNVEVDTVPAPVKLNKKREESKKLPFFEYKVLTVAPGKSYSRLSSGGLVDHRESPRQHLRRGHIRRLQSGVTIWITAHLVGERSKGRIEKDYEVKVPGQKEAAVS